MDAKRLLRGLFRDRYSAVGWGIFASIVLVEWRPYVRNHEAMYLLGPRRVADPELLAGDLVWDPLPPTTFLFDHALAPLVSLLSDFEVMVVGRLVAWSLLAWGIAKLARQLRLPGWAVVAGFAFWLLWGQTLASCGSMVEGFQPKSFAYPLIFAALGFALEGRPGRAGVAAGIGTAFHIIVGGWGCLAVFATLLLDRARFSLRDAALFLAGTAPCVGPLVLSVGLFHAGALGGGEQARMDEIYVTFAQPHCVDPTFFMNQSRWWRALAIFPTSLALLLLWPRREVSRSLVFFLAVLIALWGLGALASQAELHGFLKLFPLQLGHSFPALFLFVAAFAVPVVRPRSIALLAVWGIAVLASIGLALDDDVPEELAALPGVLAEAWPPEEPSRYGRRGAGDRAEVYAWIRENTDPRSQFVTPHLAEFWTYAERPQVASFRHPPLDKALIEWHERLLRLNGGKPFRRRGFDVRVEIDRGVATLTRDDLRELAEQWGATHYLSDRPPKALEDLRLYWANGWGVYGLEGLAAE